MISLETIKLTLSCICLTIFVSLLFFLILHREMPPLPIVNAKQTAKSQPEKMDSETVNLQPLKLPLKDPLIIISKSKRQLVLYSAGDAVRVYRIGLGLNPIDDKTKEGDYSTPEGEFYVFTKNPKSKYYLSLGLSYPNAEDAERGLSDGLITRAEHDEILKAIQKRLMPPQKTALGGEIYIHGGGSARDWTWGCIALENENMRELFDAVERGTAVVIEH